jgi:hypothetical protein
MVSLGKCTLKGLFIGVLVTLLRPDFCSNNIHCSLSLSHSSYTRLATLSLCEDNHSVDLVLVDVVQSTLWKAINKEVLCLRSRFHSCWYCVLSLSIQLVVHNCDNYLSFKWSSLLFSFTFLTLTLQDPSK